MHVFPRNPLATAEADISSRTFPAVIRQQIDLESCSNPLKIRSPLALIFFNWEVLELSFFVVTSQ